MIRPMHYPVRKRTCRVWALPDHGSIDENLYVLMWETADATIRKKSLSDHQRSSLVQELLDNGITHDEIIFIPKRYHQAGY